MDCLHLSSSFSNPPSPHYHRNHNHHHHHLLLLLIHCIITTTFISDDSSQFFLNHRWYWSQIAIHIQHLSVMRYVRVLRKQNSTTHPGESKVLSPKKAKQNCSFSVHTGFPHPVIPLWLSGRSCASHIKSCDLLPFWFHLSLRDKLKWNLAWKLVMYVIVTHMVKSFSFHLFPTLF